MVVQPLFDQFGVDERHPTDVANGQLRDVNYSCAPATTIFVHLRGAQAEPAALPNFSTAAA